MQHKEGSYEYGMWPAVIALILFFTVFAVAFLKPKKKREWRSLGLFEAFLVALYTEMYGFPLTIYLLSTYFGVKIPFLHIRGHLWASLFNLSDGVAMFICQTGSLFMVLGLIFLGAGWRRIYKGKEGLLVTEGVYSYIRHPQYLGLMLILVGMLIQWPTLLTVAMFPFLFIAYRRLAGREERELAGKFGETFQEYKRLVPSRFIPMYLLREKKRRTQPS